jgi:hypothetical protein
MQNRLLPGYRPPGEASVPSIAPVTNAILQGVQDRRNYLQAERQQANADRQFGLQREGMDFRREQATREAAMAAERMRMQQEQHAESMDMRGQQIRLERERFGLTKKQFDEKRKQLGAQRAGRLALAILNDSDQARAAANWQKMVQASPQFAEQLQRYGQDPSDWRSGARFIAAEAGMLPEEQADQRKVMEVNGRLVRVGSSGLGEVVYEPPETKQAPKQDKLYTVGKTLVDREGKVIYDGNQSTQAAEQAGIQGGIDQLAAVPQDYKGLENAIGTFQGDDSGYFLAPISRVFGSIAAGLEGADSPSQIRRKIRGDTEALATAIKPLIRKPGEGTWTDADQARLVSIVGDLQLANTKEEYLKGVNDVVRRLNANFNLNLKPVETQPSRPRARNRQTGEIIEYIDGQWVPAP